MLGRSPRRHVWILQGLFIFGIVAASPLSLVSEDLAFSVFSALALVVFIASFIISIRRLHDMDFSGWWMLVSFIPLAGLVLGLVILFGAGTEGANRFGDNPRGLPLRTQLYQYAIASRENEGEFNLFDPIRSFIRTVRSVVTRPVGFFAGIARQGDFLNPLIFAAVCAMIIGILVSFVALLIGTYTSLADLITVVILLPIGWAINLFMGAGIYHLLVLLLVRPNAGFEATFRVLAYTSVPLLVTSLVAAIPILNILIGLVAGTYGIVLGIIGIRETHSTTTGRAAAVVLTPPLVVVLIVVAIVGAA